MTSHRKGFLLCIATIPGTEVYHDIDIIVKSLTNGGYKIVLLEVTGKPSVIGNVFESYNINGINLKLEAAFLLGCALRWEHEKYVSEMLAKGFVVVLYGLPAVLGCKALPYEWQSACVDGLITPDQILVLGSNTWVDEICVCGVASSMCQNIMVGNGADVRDGLLSRAGANMMWQWSLS